MAPRFLFYYLLVSLLFCDLVCGFWWSFGSKAVMDYSRICGRRGRRKPKNPLNFLCKKEPTTVNLILTGTQLAMKECHYQFRNHRWNCTDNRRSLRRIFSKETPEAAFLNSIMSAAVTYEITAACSRGDLLECSCSRNAYETDAFAPKRSRIRPDRKRRKEAKYAAGEEEGESESDQREDDRERRKNKRRRERKRRRKTSKAERRRKKKERRRERIQRISNSLDASVPSVPQEIQISHPQEKEEEVTIVQPLSIPEAPMVPGASQPEGVIGKDWHWRGCDDNVAFGYRVAKDLLEKSLRGRKSQDIKSMVMLRNNEAGRLAIRNHLRPHCKCHGLSGSCSHRTCWRRMPSFRNTGTMLSEKYRLSIKVIPSNDAVSIIPAIESYNPPDEEDLVFLEDSPDFCEANRKTGSLGTRGRRCNATSMDSGGCDSLCCGRTYESQMKLESENCHCRFTFCCEVTCQTCKVGRKYSYCT